MRSALLVGRAEPAIVVIFGGTRREIEMIEDTTMLLIYLMIGVPTVIGIIWAILTRPSKYYYKFNGGRILKIDSRRSGKEK